MKNRIKWWFECLIYNVKDKWEEWKPYFKKTLDDKTFRGIIATLITCGVLFTSIINSEIYGLFELACEQVEIVKEQKIEFEVIEKWYKQLPEDHDMKIMYGYCDLNKLYTACISTGKAVNKTSISVLSGIEYIGDFIGQGLEYKESIDLEQYSLKCSEEEIKALKIKVGEVEQLQFYYRDTPYSFDFDIDSISEYNAIRMVYSYIDDTEIARIYDGEIVGMQKGETILHLYCNGYHFKYTVKVK